MALPYLIDNWRLIWPHTRGARHRIAFFFTAQVFNGFTNALSVYLLARIISALQRADTDALSEVMVLLAIMAVSSMLGFAVLQLGRQQEFVTANIVRHSLISTSYTTLLSQPLSWHSDHHSGGLISRINNASTHVAELCSNGFASVVNLSFIFFISVGMIVNVPLIGVWLLVFNCSLAAIVIYLNRSMRDKVSDQNKSLHALSATLQDYLSNIVTLITLRLNGPTTESLQSRIADANHYRLVACRYSQIRWRIFVNASILLVPAVTLGVFAHYDWNIGLVDLGMLVFFIQGQALLRNGFEQYIMQHQSWMYQNGAIRDLYAVLGTTNPLAMVPAPANASEVLLKDINFGFSPQRQVLTIPNLTLRQGERIALIGSSGSGKSTLLSVLRGLNVSPTASLRIDGSPHPFAALGQATTLIPQDPEIFENTVRFNVALGLAIEDELIVNMLRLVCLDNVVARLPAGLDTDIREKGVNLSVGQKQRLALARGLLAAQNSLLVLMDEPTSSVDLQTEEAIFHNIFGSLKGRILVASLHRLHLLPQFDRVILMQEGVAVADLTVREALHTAGPIRDIYQRYQQREAMAAAIGGAEG